MSQSKTFQENLEYWLWVTKGARFTAHERCLRQNMWSNIAIGLLSAYILIINLVSVFGITDCVYFNGNIVAFWTTALSILILVFGQLENSNDFKLKAEKYHNCARELAKIYRRLKSLDHETDKEVLKQIQEEYQAVLDIYENHKRIDYNYYRVTHPDDFKIGFWVGSGIRLQFYLLSISLYHLLILAPPILLFYFGTHCS